MTTTNSTKPSSTRIRRLPRTRLSRARRNRQSRRGTIILLTAAMLVFLVGLLALSIDLGYIAVLDTEVQRSADAGALAGAGMLPVGKAEALDAAAQYVELNAVGRDSIAQTDMKIELGVWNAGAFVVDNGSPTAVRVFARQTQCPFFFGQIFGGDAFDVESEAIATYRPRDIVVVLDYSASMNDDSELKHMNRLGRAAIENNLLEIYNEMGAPELGNMQWAPQHIPSGSNSAIKAALGLDAIPYPYPSGSWNDYINYVKNNGAVASAGYRNRYGYLTLVNYWLDRKPGADETPSLWQTSEQPITAVKDAVQVFLAFLQEVKSDDRVGLSIYTSNNGQGLLESQLTKNYQLVEDISRQRQAGHYHQYTNISGGMNKARVELETRGRGGAQQLMVLMTDGKANWTNGGYSTSGARAAVIQEANLAANKGIKIVTISLGADADQNLMQQAADITNGHHFNIPGGQSVADYEEDLKDAFREVAKNRQIQLVK